MKKCTQCNTTQPLTEYHKRRASPDGLNARCKTCIKAKGAEYVARNKDMVYAKNREYYAGNKGVFRAKEAKRRAAELQRTPSWDSELNEFAIKEVYSLCRLRSDTTGVPHHVDHIVPLQGEKVSGLHVWNNLQVLTATENLQKSNNYG